MKPYPITKSPHSRFAEWTVTNRDNTEIKGGAFLSFTKPRRALWRLIAHLEKEVPNAARYDASFPTDDIYCGLEGAAEMTDAERIAGLRNQVKLLRAAAAFSLRVQDNNGMGEDDDAEALRSALAATKGAL